MADEQLMGRRKVLVTASAAAGITAVAALPSLARASAPAAAASPAAEDQPADELDGWVRDLSDPGRGTPAHAQAVALVPEGMELGNWFVERVYTPRMGALPVVLRTPEGDRFQVDVLRRAEGDEDTAVAVSSAHALYVVNRGDGRTSTDEMQARGTIVLANFLSQQTARGLRGPELLSRAERAASHPDARFGVLFTG